MLSDPARAYQPAASPAHPGGRGFAGLATSAGLGGSCAQDHAAACCRLAPRDLKMARRLGHRIGRLACDAGGTPPRQDRPVAIALAAPADLRPQK